MKIKIELELTPKEAQECFVPGDKQDEFMTKTYDAYVAALRGMVWDQIDPHNFFNRKNEDA